MTEASTPLLETRSLRKEFPVGRGLRKSSFAAVDDVSITVGRGSTLAVVGESGSGKSTLARMCGMLLEPTSGSVHLAGEEYTASAAPARMKHFRKNVQFVFQDPYSSLNPRHTVEEIITAPLRYQSLNPGRDLRGFAQDLMDRVGLNPDHIDRLPSQFSGGQAQRIGIARAIACRPELVICDEAVSALDVSVQAQVLRLLVDLQLDYGLSYIFITHDLSVVRLIATDIVVMRQGHLEETGTAEQVLDRPEAQYTKDLIAAAPEFPADWNMS
ncbi:ATP-binding cassette domain-containing protein [Microbacterium sp. NPDC057650]|uniref:ATP-binding cassette domain-containing protein n=1 Tax=unclassified Microbacterium TaxID=2609290 RepID=UPI003670BE56